MLKTRLFLAALACTLPLQAVPSAAAPLYAKVGVWAVERRVAGCAMTRQDGATAATMIGFRNDTGGALVASPSLGNLDKSQSYDARLRFDSDTPLTGTVHVDHVGDTSVLDVIIPGKAAFADALLHKASLSILLGGVPVMTVSLADNRAAVQSLVACQDSVDHGGGEPSSPQ